MFPPIELAAMSEQVRFILDLGAAVAVALVGGAIAVRLRQPPIVGYLLAGVVIGPFTPGFVGDVEHISTLADVGIVLLLFALGVQFSIRELREVQRVALPAGFAQVVATVGLGTLAGLAIGLDLRGALVIGACLSVSSTLVLLKNLLDRGEGDSLHGRMAIGWSVVQDIATIVFIVALPAIAGGDLVGPIAIALAKAAIFLALAFVLGTRLFPWMFRAVATLGSSELFLLAVVATALLTAFVSSAVFGLSLALGAFVAGVLVSESDLSHQAAAEVLPFRDLFAVLFFVSVGMLLDPVALLNDLPAVLLLVVLATIVKAGLSTGLARARGLPMRSAILLGAGLGQVGEFSFLIVEEALGLDIVDERVVNLVLATTIVAILVSPLVVWLGGNIAERWDRRADLVPRPLTAPPAPARAPTSRSESQLEASASEARTSIVVLGAGRIGRVIVNAARARGFRTVVVDRDPRRLDEVARSGAVTLFGDAASPDILARAGLDRARVLIITMADPLTARLAAERARRIHPGLTIAARARAREEASRLRAEGVQRIADPEAEAALELARYALQRMGVSGPELTAIITGLRRETYRS